MPPAQDYKTAGGITRKAVVFLILCKSGDPHRHEQTHASYTGAKAVARRIDELHPDCGPHQAAAYGPLT